MKLSARDAQAFLRNPKADTAGVLFFGADAMRIAIKRADLLKQLLGDNAEEDMRLTRLSGGELRSDPSRLQDALKAIGFFPGPRGVLVTDGGDGLAKVVDEALKSWEKGDATLVIEAGNLGKASKLRKAVEAAPNALAIGIYDDPPSRADVEEMLGKAGLSTADNDAKAALMELARVLDPGDFRQLVEKVSLYMLTASDPLSVADVEACAPASTEAALDDAIRALADCDVAHIGPSLHRLATQGSTATTICIAATRHFKALHQAASHGGGPEQALSSLRPPVFGPRRDAMARQIRSWGRTKLEAALHELFDTDLQLRSGGEYPPMALTERAFIRIAMRGRARS